MKKLYIVTIEAEAVVLAESEEEAEEIAQDCSIDIEFDHHAGEMTYLPNGWDGGCIPFGDDEDLTINEHADRGAAETYRKLRDVNRARRAAKTTDTSTVEPKP